ncbi:MAG: hypothetical protein KJ025_05495 [Burkholderiales bacterium]|nr:hypothetical protein [Burkholderiales bacterium]
MRAPAQFWRAARLQLNANGTPYLNAANVARVLDFHPDYKGALYFDRFYQRVRVDHDATPRDWRDVDELRLLRLLQTEVGLPRIGIDPVRQGVELVAHEHERCEPLSWLLGLRWDGVSRADLLVSRAFGGDDTAYAIAIGANLLKAAAARLIWPGCKHDHIVVLESGQGRLKSQALETLGGDWYGEILSPLGSKDAILELHGRLIVELPELEALNRREPETIKAFASRRVDNFRPPYGRRTLELPRTSVMVGTTNESHYLRDATGARRFWPVRCGAIDLDWIGANREQLFAEALHRVRELREPWWEVPAGEAAAAQEQRYEGDPWEDRVAMHVAQLRQVEIGELLRAAVGLEAARQDRRAQLRAGAILRRLGWARRQVGALRRRVWEAPAEEGSVGSGVVRLDRRARSASEPTEPIEPSSGK